MRKAAGDILVGDKVTYLAGAGASAGLCRQGTVMAVPIADPYTEVLWIPTLPDGAAADTEPTWVRHDRVVEVAPP